MRLITSRGAVGDIIAIRRWYQTQKQHLDERFQAELDVALQAIIERPTSFPEVARGVRRVQLERFPYLVFFRQDHDAGAIVVFAVTHGSRHPRVWRRRR